MSSLPPGFEYWQKSEVGENIQLSTEPIMTQFVKFLGLAVHGNLVAVAWDTVPFGAPGDPEVGDKIIFRKSRDGGRTWDPPLVLRQNPPMSAAFTNNIIIDDCGTIYVVARLRQERKDAVFKSTDGGESFHDIAPLRAPQYGDQPPPFGPFSNMSYRPPCNDLYFLKDGYEGDLNAYLMVSHDGGQTFTVYAHRIYTDHPFWPGIVDIHLARSRSGTIFIAGLGPDPDDPGPLYNTQLYLWRSDDDGKTLQLVNSKIIDPAVYFPDPYNQVLMSVSDDGRSVYLLWLNIVEHTWVKCQWMVSVSHDGGVTFAPPVQLKYNDLLYQNNIGHRGDVAEFKGIIYTVFTSDGLQERPPRDWPPPSPPGYYNRLLLSYSHDGGKAFSPPLLVTDLVKSIDPRYLMNSNVKYSVRIAVGEDGTLHMAWVEDRYGGGRKYECCLGGDEIFYAQYKP